MAGGDPLSEAFSGDLDDYATRRARRREKRAGRLARLQQVVQEREQMAANAATVEAGLSPAAQPGMGDLRATEAKDTADRAPVTLDEFETNLNELRKQRDTEAAQFQKVRDESLALYRSDPGRYAHLFSNERTEALKAWQQNLDALEKEIAKRNDALEKAKAEQYADVPEPESGGFMSTVGTLLANTPLAGASETLGGLASYAAEGLGSLMGGPSEKFTDFSDMSASGAALNLNPIGLIANAMGVGTADSELRQRGREFYAKGGQAMSAGGLNVRHLTGLDQLAHVSGYEKEWAEILRDGTVDDMLNSMALQASSDPLNLVPGGAGSALVKAAWKPIAQRFPTLTKYPEKFVLRLLGKHKAADVLRNNKMEKLLEVQGADEAQAGYEYLKFEQDVREANVATLKKLENLTDVQQKRVADILPAVIEQTDPTMRAAARAGLAPDDVVQRTILDTADQYNDFAIRAIALDKKFGSKIAELGGEYNYLGRRYSPKLQDYLAKNPDAQKIIFGAQMGSSRKAMETALEGWEKHRKLVDFDFHESEKIVRDMLEKSHGLPKDIPIWDRDHLGGLADRARAASEKAAHRNLMVNAAEVLSVPNPQADVAIKQITDTFDGLGDDAAKMSQDEMVAFVTTQVKAAGLTPPPLHMSALDLAKQANAQLPDDIADLARMAVSYIDPKTAKDFQKYAANWYANETPSTFFKYWDGLKAIYQRATLSSPPSLMKDLHGTAVQSWFSRDHHQIGSAIKALGGTPGKWKQGIGVGYKAADDVLRLQAEGVLHTTVGESLRKGAFESVPVLGRIEERGVLGALLPGKAGKAVQKVTDTLLETRTFFEQAHRLATYRRAISEGMSHADAVEEVYKYWGKFNELSKLEKNVLNRIMFFAMWRLRSMPVALRMILDHPVRSKMLMTMMAGNVRDDETQPEWLRRMGGWRIGTDANGNARVINIGGNSYFGPLSSLLESNLIHGLRKGEVADAPANLAREALRGAPPFVTAPIEAATGMEAFSGKAHYDERGIQQTQASPLFYWFTTEDQSGAVERLLNLQVQRDKEGRIKRITMSPGWATLFGGLPGVEPLLTNLGNVVDPRDSENPYSLRNRTPEMSPARAMSRMLGTPIYSVPITTEEQQRIKTLRAALAKDAKNLTGGSLVTAWRDGSQRLVPSGTERGQRLAADIDRWEAEGKARGLQPHALRMFVGEQLSHHYQDEWKLMELDRTLEYAENYMQQVEGKDKPRLSVADLAKPSKLGKGPERAKKVWEREEDRRLSKLGFR